MTTTSIIVLIGSAISVAAGLTVLIYLYVTRRRSSKDSLDPPTEEISPVPPIYHQASGISQKSGVYQVPRADRVPRADQATTGVAGITALAGFDPTFRVDDTGARVVWRGNNSELHPFVDAGGADYVARVSTRPVTPSYRERYVAIQHMSPRRKRELGIVNTSIVNSEDSTGDADLVVMSRVPGIGLGQYIENHATDPLSLWRLADRLKERFLAFGSTRASAQPFAHGDLQAENILVTEKGSVWLVDYDDVYLPGLQPTQGIGHRSFQHPGRGPEHWGPWMDTFSSVLIFAAVRAIASRPELMELSSDVSILFTGYDLENPEDTELWKSLDAVNDPPVKRALAKLSEWCRADTPPLEPFPGNDLAAWRADD